MSNKLEQLKLKLEKILGFRNMQEKLENNIMRHSLSARVRNKTGQEPL